MATSPNIYQLKVTLDNIKPPVYRRVLVPGNITLYKLHEILQIVMGWENYHLHIFTIDGQIYGDPEGDEYGEMGTKNETRYRLNQVVQSEGGKFHYEYDFGDSWAHTLLVEKILPAEKGGRYPVCVTGKRACPPEDVGGIWGYEDFLKSISNPNHPEHDEMMEWSGGDFDPERFDLEKINERLHHRRRKRDENEEGIYAPPQTEDAFLDRLTAWANGLNEEQLTLAESLPVRRDMVTFLNYLVDKRPVGTQSTGNLPLKAVREVCAQFANPPKLDEMIGDRLYKLRSEDDVWPLFFLHMLANTGGLAAGGQSRKWTVTSNGETFLNLIAPIQLGYMLYIWWHWEDWRIAFPVSGLSQGLPNNFKRVSLARLLELTPTKTIPFEPFADRLVNETHMIWPIADQETAKKILRSAVYRLVILPLAGFGVLEYESPEFSGPRKICLTPVGQQMLDLLR